MKTKSRSLVYYTTDLLNSTEDIASAGHTEVDIVIPTVVNIDNKIHTNFLKQATEKYPVIQKHLELEKHTLGKNSYVDVARYGNNKIYFCQMFCDRNTKHRNINYIHLVNCMVGVRNFCLQNKDKRTEIHSPKFGTSCSGGRWSTISDLIQDCWQGLPVYIYRNS